VEGLDGKFFGLPPEPGEGLGGKKNFMMVLVSYGYFFCSEPKI